MPKHYDPAFGISSEDLEILDSTAADLHAFADALQTGIAPESAQTFGRLIFDRALALEALNTRVSETDLTNKAPLCFSNEEALELERLFTLVWAIASVRDLPPEFADDVEAINELWNSIVRRNRAAGLKPPQETTDELKRRGAA